MHYLKRASLFISSLVLGACCFSAKAADYSPASNGSGLASAPIFSQQEEVPQPYEEDSFLPFFGKEARERGYELPKPFGINLNYMNIKQDIVVTGINFENLSLGKLPIPSNLFAINVKETEQRSHTETLRLDAWVFPFMNVYGILGRTKGHSLSSVDVGSTDPMVNAIIKRMGDMDDVDFRLDFKGTTYGAGTTFAGGIGNWFGILDMNYTRTKLNIIDGKIDAFTLAPRIGYRFKTPAVESIFLPEGHFSLWVGTMYQKVEQTFRGKLSDLKFTPKLQSIIDAVNSKNEGRFHVEQHLKSPWNILVGGRWEIGKHFNVLTEVGFKERKSFFAALEYRF